jgi:sigma-B regulation protein RsbU (phosphoserine phosphatase)
MQLALLRRAESGAMDVHLASAAHPPAIILRADGSSETTTGGSIVGVWRDAEVGEAHFSLEPGETLMTYTDGWLEAGPVDRHRTPEDLARALTEGRTEDLDALVDRLRRDAVERGGAELRDDLVLFAVRPTGAREPAAPASTA